MQIVRCENKHLFDESIHGACPICNSASSTQIEDSNDQFPVSEPIQIEIDKIKNLLEDDRKSILPEKYRLVTNLASGGMGHIFLAQERLSGRFVALKIMNDRALNVDSLVRQFVKEAIITARFQHPNIIPIYDLGFFSEKKLFYTMRYIEGTPFSYIIEDPAYDRIEKIRILRSAAQAVYYAHQQGLWHRDLKPENILVGALGDAYVIDWGLVSVQPSKSYNFHIPKIAIDRQSSIATVFLEQSDFSDESNYDDILGTPAYMSPEQINKGCGNGCSCDVWAFGIMLYQILFDSHPIRGRAHMNPYEILAKMATEGTISIQFERHEIQNELMPLANVCSQMLEWDWAKRSADLAPFIFEASKLVKSMRPAERELAVSGPISEPATRDAIIKWINGLSKKMVDLGSSIKRNFVYKSINFLISYTQRLLKSLKKSDKLETTPIWPTFASLPSIQPFEDWIYLSDVIGNSGLEKEQISDMQTISPDGNHLFVKSYDRKRNYVEYNLGGNYDCLKAVIGITWQNLADEQMHSLNAYFRILGDGIQLCALPIYCLENLEMISVNLSAVSTLRLEIYLDGNMDKIEVAFSIWANVRIRRTLK